MTEAEKFKTWLETIYISPKTGKPLRSGQQYATGINALNKQFKLLGDGIYDKGTNLKQIRKLIDLPENFHKDYSSHFNAFLKFRDYCTERENKKIPPLQRQIDIFKRQKVEIAAVETTINHFENMGYIVISKEKDNLGWDLEATNIMETLFLEVKGLSGSITSIEVTPNEYKNLNERNSHYKLCVVTNALTKPKLEIFSYNSIDKIWTNENDEKLIVQEKVAARMWKE